jgi:6-phosphofructokinase 2
MDKVLTVTLNPALDVSTSVGAVRPDIKLRCAAPRIDPGGGGVNVSRAMTKLGATSVAFIALGGPTGETLLARLRDEQIDVVRFDIAGDTCQSFAIREETSGHQYRFILPGPDWSPTIFENCLNTLERQIARDDIVVVSGSFPPGLPPAAAVETCAVAESRGARALIDTSGPALHALLNTTAGDGRTLIMNKDETEKVAGGLVDIPGAAALVRRLVNERRADTAITTLGAAGAVAASRDGVWHVAPPDAPVISKVGAGDSFAAAYVIALSKRQSTEAALRHAMAAATSAITTPAAQLCTREGTETYLSNVDVRAL